MILDTWENPALCRNVTHQHLLAPPGRDARPGRDLEAILAEARAYNAAHQESGGPRATP